MGISVGHRPASDGDAQLDLDTLKNHEVHQKSPQYITCK